MANLQSLRNKEQKSFLQLETHRYCRNNSVPAVFALQNLRFCSAWLNGWFQLVNLARRAKLQHHKIQKHHQRSFRNRCPKHLIGGSESILLLFGAFSCWGCRMATSPEMVEPIKQSLGAISRLFWRFPQIKWTRTDQEILQFSMSLSNRVKSADSQTLLGHVADQLLGFFFLKTTFQEHLLDWMPLKPRSYCIKSP